MGRKIIFTVILLITTGCADFELHIKKEARGIKPAVILICPFDIRNMNYDPHISSEFSDSLKFEFFKRGYNSVIVGKSDKPTGYDSEWAVKICADHSGDVLIKGVISQRETGFFADRKNSTLISFIVYDKKGKVIGEGFYHDNESAGDESLRRRASGKFVSSLLENLEKAE